MAWIVNRPIASTKLRDADNYIRNNFIAIDDAISREHNNISAESNPAQELPGLCNIIKVGTTTVISALSDVDGGLAYTTDMYDFYVNNGSGWNRARQMATGAKCLFWQAAAPNGWTIDTSSKLADAAILINSSTGTASGGSWTISALNYSGTHRHTLPTVPYHTHSFNYTDGSAGASEAALKLTFSSGVSPPEFNAAGVTTAYTMDEAPQGISISSTGAWRPVGSVFIVCTKD